MEPARLTSALEAPQAGRPMHLRSYFIFISADSRAGRRRFTRSTNVVANVNTKNDSTKKKYISDLSALLKCQSSPGPLSTMKYAVTER